MKKLFNIIYKNGSNEIKLFTDVKEFGQWWKTAVKFGNRKRNSVFTFKPVNGIL